MKRFGDPATKIIILPGLLDAFVVRRNKHAGVTYDLHR